MIVTPDQGSVLGIDCLPRQSPEQPRKAIEDKTHDSEREFRDHPLSLTCRSRESLLERSVDFNCCVSDSEKELDKKKLMSVTQVNLKERGLDKEPGHPHR